MVQQATTSGSDTESSVVSRDRIQTALKGLGMLAWSWDFESNQVIHLGDPESICETEIDTPEAFLELVHAEDRARVVAAIKRVRKQGGIYDEEFRLKLPSGRVIWVSDRGSLRLDEDGKPIGMTGVLTEITRRKETDQALRYQLNVTRSITDNAAESIFLLDPEGKVTFANAEAETTFGYTATEMLGQTLDDFLHRDHADDQPHPKEACPLRRVLHSGLPLRNHEDIFYRRDGTALDVVCSNSPIIVDGKVTGSVLVVHDITKQKEVQRTLVVSEERYRSLTRVMSSVVWTTNEEGYFASHQREWETFTGQPWRQHQGWGWSRMLHPEDREGTEHAFREALQSRSSFERRVRIWHAASREYHHCVIRAVPLFNPNGSVREWIGTVTDVHQQQIAEERLRENRERLNTLFDQMLIGIIQTDLTGRIVLANRRFCEIVGRSLEELTSLRMQDITHPEDLPKNIALFGRAASGGDGYEFEKRYLRPDGTAVWTRIQVRAIRDATGAPKYLSGVCEDMTPRKQAESQLEQLIHREREAREQAERANRAKDSFLATLSHELRTPLTPVLMTAAARAEDQALDPELREEFAGIRRNIELEARLIDDLLDLTRVARGKLPLVLGKVDMHGLLAHTAEIVRGDAELKGVWLTFDLEAHCFVEGDVARLQQVFWNLLKNAIKFTPPQGRITVHARKIEGDAVEVVIQDTGIGIPTEVMPHIFEAFEQGEVAGQHRFGGMGLGLAITKAIVEMHKGQISVHSAGRGKGATFRVQFRTTEAPTEAPVAAVAKVTAPPKPLRLLVVEDHPPTLAVLTKLLERRGHKVEPASTVRGALAIAEVNRFDLVITDLGLPDGNGLELMQKLSAEYGLLGIALTGYGMEDDIARTKAAGFRAHLVKPISFELLDQTLEPFMRGAVE